MRRLRFNPWVGRPPGEENGNTPVFLPGESHGQRSLACYRPRSHKSWTQLSDSTATTNALNTHWKDWCWSWNANDLATWCEELTHWKIPWCWERLKAGGEGDDRGWDGWMASLTRWTWVWASSGSSWWTGKPGSSPWGCKESDMIE